MGRGMMHFWEEAAKLKDDVETDKSYHDYVIKFYREEERMKEEKQKQTKLL